MTSGAKNFLSRSSDHLGNLANILKDLGGGATLLSELTQNANDAQAEAISFVASDDDLIVYNSAEFSDCGRQRDSNICPWKADEGGRSCDLHSFRRVAGRHKEGDDTTTGAFGVGFTAVYQVTDHPELVTGGRHLVLDELRVENERIMECAGECQRDHGTPGTTFYLPWARAQTDLRRELGASALDQDDIVDLMEQMHEAAGPALVFLDHVERLDVVAGGVTTNVTRGRTGDLVTLTIDGEPGKWLLLEGTAKEAESLRARYGQEGARSARVQVAVPTSGDIVGRIYADLPTETPTGWGGHINATFFPRQDRKTVEFDGSGFRGKWNDLLVDAAAQVVAEGLETIASRLGHVVAWSFLVDAELIRRGVGKAEYPKAFGAFFDRAKRSVPGLPVALLADGRSSYPAGSIVPRDEVEYEAIDVLMRLGLPIVDASIRPQVLSVSYTEYGIRQLAAADVVRGLRELGMSEPWAPGEAARVSEADVESVLRLLSHLQDRGKAALSSANADSVAIVPCVDGTFAPANAVSKLDGDDRVLFELLEPGLKILDEPRLSLLCPELAELCAEITPERAIEIFERDHEALGVAPAEVLDWLDDHRAALHDESVRDRVRALPIFPSAAGGYKPLAELSLASDFQDVLGVADVVDRRRASGHEDLLRLLGAKQLDSVEYLTRHVIPMAEAGSLDVSSLRQVLEVIHNARSALEGRVGAKDHLSSAPLVACMDGQARAARAVHLANPALALISPDEPIADTSGLASHLVETLCWLGVARAPSSQVLAAAAVRMAAGDEDPPHHVVLAILDALTEPLPEVVPPVMRPLVDEAWLPVEGGGRAAPRQVYAAFRREIFESQGPRLALSRTDQNLRAQKLDWLGVHSNPTTAMVVAHLRHCAAEGEELNAQVYRALAEVKPKDAHLVENLRGEACVQVRPGEFVEPRSVFWSDPGLGRWAHLLDPTYRQFQTFFDLIGVRDTPSPSQIERILRDMSRTLGNDPLGAGDRSVVHRCWEMLDEQLLDESTEAETRLALSRLRHVRSALDGRGMLDKPEMLLFADGRRVAEKFDLVRNNLIRRDRSTRRALAEAGVRPAESVITTLVDDDVDSAPAPQLQMRLEERMPAIRRLVESHSDDDLAYDLDKLTGVQLATVPELLVRYRVRFAHHEQTTDPERADAVLLDEQRQLLVRSQSASRQLARELARCMDPAADVSLIAPSLHEIISADTLDEAMEVLNEYGVRDLDETAWEHVATEVSEAGDVGGPGWHVGGPVQGDSEPASEEPVPDARPGTDGESRDHRQGGLPDSGGTRRRPPSKKGSGRARVQMASFVSFDDDDDDTADTEVDAASTRSAVDSVGVLRVLQYEESCGRVPREMAHNNPGFDVESSDAQGNIVRRIEVKSIGGAWTGFGVWLSATQLDESRRHGDDFWLYVVEHAEDDDAAVIHRIHNPVQHATKYGFDAGWQALREPDIERDVSGKPLVGSTRRLLGWGGTT